MKTLTLLFGAALLAALSANAADTPAAAPAPESPPPAASPAPQPAPESKPAAPPEQPAPAVAEAPAGDAIQTNSLALSDTNLLRLNFRGAPLDTVLNYLSEAAGYIINLEATPRGRVDVWSATPVTREEALDLLDSVLRKNGFAAIRNGRTLTIVNRDEAKIHSIPVKMGSDPQSIPRNDEIVTQILPVKFVEVVQLVKDLQPLVSMQTTITANEAGNSIVITDTQANIRRIAEIIQAIDMGAEDVTEVHVFRLQYSDPTEMADLLSSLFPDESRTSSQSGQGGFSRFFGRFGPPGMMGNASSSSSGSQTQRVKRRARVLAVADPRTASLVVTAAKDLMPQIQDVVKELDSNPARKQSVHVYKLQNADAEEVQQVLQDMFERNTTSSNRRNNQNSTLSNRRSTQENSNNSRNSSRNNSSTGSFGR